MDRLLWSDAALDDLYRLRAGLTAEPAKRVGRIIAEAVDCLAAFPERGGVDPLSGARALPLPGLPWRLLYRATADEVVILRLL